MPCRLKRGEVDLRLEKVVASKQLRLAVETEEERRTRLEAFLKSWQLCLSFKLDVLTTYIPTTERNIDHDLLFASLGLGGVLEVCGECYNLGPVVFILSPPPLYFVFENT